MVLDFRTTSHRSATTIDIQEAAYKMNQPSMMLPPTTPPYGRQCPKRESDIANNAECSFAVAKERGSQGEAMVVENGSDTHGGRTIRAFGVEADHCRGLVPFQARRKRDLRS
jgi:hypothetical protein